LFWKCPLNPKNIVQAIPEAAAAALVVATNMRTSSGVPLLHNESDSNEHGVTENS